MQQDTTHDILLDMAREDPLVYLPFYLDGHDQWECRFCGRQINVRYKRDGWPDYPMHYPHAITCVWARADVWARDRKKQSSWRWKRPKAS